MKKLANVIALFILVSVNVLTPISYAQETPEVEEISTVVVSQEEEQSGEEGLTLNEGTQELVEDLPEILEDDAPSLIDMVVDTVLEDIDRSFEDEVEENEEGEDDVTDLMLFAENVGEPQIEVAEEGSHPSQDGCYTYNFVEGGIEIVSYSGDCSKFVDLSNGIDGYDVISIGERAFYQKGITGVIFGDTVESIGSRAFGNGYYDGRTLEYISLGRGLKYLGYYALGNMMSDADIIHFSEGFDYDGLLVGTGSSTPKYRFYLMGGDNNCFSFNVADREISQYLCDETVVIVPEKIGGFTVRGIDGYSHGCVSSPTFFSDVVKKVIVPSSVEIIREGAACPALIHDCSLTETDYLEAAELTNHGTQRLVGINPYPGQELSSSITNGMLNDACMYISEEHTVKFYGENGDLIKQVTVEGYIDDSDFPVITQREGYKILWIDQRGDVYDGEIVSEDLMLTLKYKRLGILHENGIIKLSDGQNEIWLRDKNVGATLSTGVSLVSELMNLANGYINANCGLVTARSADENDSSLDSEFLGKASNIIGFSGTLTCESLLSFMNSYQKEYKKSFGNYYFRGNTGYATYDEMNFDNYGYSTGISEDAVARGFIDGGKMNERNTGWEEGRINNPCDVTKGEYLPTPENWANLMNIWASLNDTNVVSEAIIGNLGTYKGSLSFGNYGDSKKFANDMLLPTAGIINFYPEGRCEEGVDQDCVEWNYDNYNSSLRAARDDLNSIGSYSVDDGNLYWNQNVYNNYAYPVRCFMVANPVTVTFDTDGGSSVQSYKVSEGTTITAPTIPTKDGYIFAGWYIEDGTKWNFEQDRVEEDMTLYAKWRFCGEGFTVKSNKCVPDDMDMEGIIEVSDGEDVIYVKDRNEGVTNDNAVMCMKVEAYGSNLMNQCRTEVDAESCMNDKVSDYLDYINELLGTSFNFEQAEQYFQEHCNSFDKRELFGTYYFRGNNNGINLYDEFESGRIEFGEYDNNSGRQPIENMSQLDEKFLEGGKLGTSEGDGWVEGKEQNNPCGGDREYLPTPEDRTRLINIWMNKNGYSFDDHLHLDLPELPQYGSINNVWQYGLHTSAMDSAGWLEFPSSIMEDQFQMDLLLPYVGAILYEHQSCAEDEGSNCDKMYYQDWGGSRLAQDENGYVGDAGAWGVEYDTVEMVIDEWYRYGGNNVASPVRCFVDVPEVLVVTLYSDGNIYKELNVVKGNTLAEPTGPSKSNYTFDGWYTEDGEKYNFDNPFTEDMTLYAKWTEKSSSGGYSGGGGGSSSKSDKSHGSADDKKETMDTKKDELKVEETKKEEQPSQGKTLDTTNSSKETFNAHQWAYSNGLTKYRTAGEARMDDPLNRSEMAKISSIFATQFLDKVPNEKKKEFCSQYPDLWKVTSDMEAFIIESCELGYMGYESNGIDALERFRPYTPVTVAEAATILSRIVWGNDNAMNGKDWYKGHLYASYNHGLIDDIKDPTKRSITRREAYLMLYRLIKDK